MTFLCKNKTRRKKETFLEAKDSKTGEKENEKAMSRISHLSIKSKRGVLSSPLRSCRHLPQSSQQLSLRFPDPTTRFFDPFRRILPDPLFFFFYSTTMPFTIN